MVLRIFSNVYFALQAQELTGVAVPKYYNPAAVNPLKYAEQVQKRKLLWSKKVGAEAFVVVLLIRFTENEVCKACEVQ